MPVGQNLHLRLFLEGVEVPVISAQIQGQKNSPAVASIQIPANDYALDLKPRTLVHLYNYDIYNGAPPPEQVSVGGPGIRRVEPEQGIDPELRGLFPPERFEQSATQEQTDLENENYKLAFGGEVVGIYYSKSPSSRAVVLQCLDWSSYWDIALQYMISGFSLGGGGIQAAFTGARTTVFNSFLDGSADIVTKLMAENPRSYPNLGGTLLGAITHLIEAIGGVYYGQRAIRGINDFFSLAEMRLHLTQMLGANPYGLRDELNLLHARGFGSLFRRSLAGLGKLVSIRQVLLALQRYIFHEIIPITSPRFIPPLTDPNLPSTETVTLEGDQETKPLADTARVIKSRAEELRERQQASSSSEEASRQSTRRGGLLRELRNLSKICDQAARRSRRAGTSSRISIDFYRIPEVTRAFSQAANHFQQLIDATRRGQRVDVTTNAFYTTDTNSSALVIGICTQIAEAMQQVLDSRHRRRVQRRTQQPDPPPRLITQIYAPNVWMVAPPRCNVIFPELYSSFNYGRQFQQEVTRLLLRTHSAFFGSDILFDGFYMSPSRLVGQRTGRPMQRGRTGIEPPDYADSPAWVVRDLMEHELYTGIIPTFERMSDLNLHGLRNGYNEINGVRVGYAQLAANHIFYQYRFRSRELGLSGKFNPYVALGFPCLVVDKYLPLPDLETSIFDTAVAAKLSEAIREGEGEYGAVPEGERQLIQEANTARVVEVLGDLLDARPNTHFLGTPAMVSHTIDATNGGTTTLQMEYARTTNEKTEFLGDNLVHSRRARRTRNRRVVSEVAALEPPRMGATGPRGGQIVEQPLDITDRFNRRQPRAARNRTATGQTRYRGGDQLPLYTGDRAFTGRRRRGTRVLVGIEQPASSYGPEVVALVGSSGQFDAATQEILVSFNAYRVVEEIGIYTPTEIELPPEDLTFPPWYGDSYRTNKVGGLYSYLFGTGALTDPLVVLEPGVEPPRNPAPPDPEAIRRSQVLSLTRTISETLGRAADTLGISGQPPTPGFSDIPDTGADEAIGPPGEPEPGGVVGEIAERSPIALATEELVRIYSRVKTNHFDVHQFLRAYTWRPIASAVDLFGTANLEITDDGEVVRGIEGFHSRAFGDFDDLRQLVALNDSGKPRTILGIDASHFDPDDGQSSSSQIAAKLDTRKEKRIQVLRYLYALMASRGVLG